MTVGVFHVKYGIVVISLTIKWCIITEMCLEHEIRKVCYCSYNIKGNWEGLLQI